jgi:hypothetical protein
MRLPKKIRHWLLFKLADFEFTARNTWRNDEELYVVRSGCIRKLIHDATRQLPDCQNTDCFRGRNDWHDSHCQWVKDREKNK